MIAKKSMYNFILGVFSQVFIVISGIVITKLILVNYGSEVNGFLSSITQIMVYLAILEAGIGAASLQALYGPFVNKDKKALNSILAATSIFYKKTGIYYFLGVIILALVYPFIVNSSLSAQEIILTILVTGLGASGGALNFYFQGKYKIFLMADGKSYIEMTYTLVFTIILSLLKVLFITNGYNIVVIQATHLFVIVLQVLCIELYMRKNYKWIDLKVLPNNRAIEQKNSAMIHQFSFLIFNNSDVILLTLFTNLKVVSVYVLFNMLFSFIDRIVSQLNKSINFVLGQTFNKDRLKFLRINSLYEIYFTAFVFTICSVIFYLAIPFMNVYTNGINDIDYTDPWLPVLFLIVKLLTNSRATANNVIEFAGHFRKTQTRSIIETIINIVISIVLVNIIGIYGVLIGTIVALTYRSIDMIIYSNKVILNQSPLRSFIRLGTNIILLILVSYLVYFVGLRADSYISLIIHGAVLSFVLIVIYFSAHSIIERKTIKDSIGLVVKAIKKAPKMKETV
jgi:O-antigen/teichoic acid export membrane protein